MTTTERSILAKMLKDCSDASMVCIELHRRPRKVAHGSFVFRLNPDKASIATDVTKTTRAGVDCPAGSDYEVRSVAR
jgi:hypothetical protein